MGKYFTGPAFALPEGTNEAENRQALLERAFSDGGEPLHITPLSLAGKTYTCKGEPGGGVSPEGQVASIPVNVRVHFLFHRAGERLKRGIAEGISSAPPLSALMRGALETC
jgi:hypothetical protein